MNQSAAAPQEPLARDWEQTRASAPGCWFGLREGDGPSHLSGNLFVTPAVPAVFNPADGHLIIVGPVGSGKTVTAQAIVISAIAAGHDVTVVEPMKQGSEWAGLLPSGTSPITDAAGFGAAVAGLRARAIANQERIVQAGALRLTDLRAEHRPKQAILVIDNAYALIANPEREESGDPHIHTDLLWLMMWGRAAGVSVIVTSSAIRHLHSSIRDNAGSRITMAERSSQKGLGTYRDIGDREVQFRSAFEPDPTAVTLPR